MWTQATDPFDSVAISAGLAALPIVVLFVLLTTKKAPGHVAAVCTLAAALLVAILGFRMPAHLALLSTATGIVNGLFPIGWIVLAAVFLYNLSVKSGGFVTVCRGIESITPDRRLQALLIAYCFGAFLEGCAGFGAPVAITTGMLVGIGFQPFYAATICLLANSAPVAFGSIGIPIITAGQTAGMDPALIGRMVAHQLPVLSFLLPFYLVTLIAGWKGAREIWPALLITAASYSATMIVVATFLGPTLPNILSSLVSMICLVLFLRVWKPKTIWRFPDEPAAAPAGDAAAIPLREQLRAWTPFVLLIVFVGNWGIGGIKAILDRATIVFPVPHLTQSILVGGKSLAVKYTFAPLTAAGTAILAAALLSALLQRMPARDIAGVAKETLARLRDPLITIGSIVGYAYLANYSGMAVALGTALTVTGRAFPFVSPIIGWIGVFVSGSDTASNALFSNMQRATAVHIGINPLLTVAANTDGGVTAKMISPQSIAVATASSKLVGEEGRLFRKTLPHSLAFLAVVCVITYLQAYYLRGMVPDLPAATALLVAANPASVALGASGIVILALSACVVAGLAFVNLSAKPDATPTTAL